MTFKKTNVPSIEISLEYAKQIHQVLENAVSMGFQMMSQEIKDMISEEAYDKLYEIYSTKHNANCGPFNRYLKKLIDKAQNTQEVQDK